MSGKCLFKRKTIRIKVNFVTEKDSTCNQVSLFFFGNFNSKSLMVGGHKRAEVFPAFANSKVTRQQRSKITMKLNKT